MFLNVEEEATLAGERGMPLQWAMETLVRCDEAKTSSKLIQVDRVHLPSSVLPLLDIMDVVLGECARTKLPTSMNPTRTCKTSEGQDGKHQWGRILSRIGILPIRTCTPYLVGMVPGRKDRVVCGSASVSCYLNSVVRCDSAHVGADVALASALTGLAPSSLFEFEVRAPEVEVVFDLVHKQEPSLIGAMVRDIARGRAPLITGVRLDLSGSKAVTAALADNDPGMFFLDGLGVDKGNVRERIVVDERTLNSWKQALPREDDPDAIYIGCPHLSEKELIRLANALDGKRPHSGPEVFFLTSQLAWDKSPRPAMVLQRFGGSCCDSCPRLGTDARHERIVTNGTRLCDCMGGSGPKASYLPLDEIIEMLLR
jgi:predicted aconitase